MFTEILRVFTHCNLVIYLFVLCSIYILLLFFVYLFIISSFVFCLFLFLLSFCFCLLVMIMFTGFSYLEAKSYCLVPVLSKLTIG